MRPDLLQPPHLFAGLQYRGYRAIAADPAQAFKSYTALQSSNWDSRRDVEKHYRTMSIEQIAALPVSDLAHPEGCHLFLWVTGPNLMGAHEIIAAWGFKYSSIGFVWAKLRRGLKDTPLFFSERDFHFGLGLTTRHNTEICLLARRGNCRRIAKNVRELTITPVREHSRKPAEAYSRIERYCAGPYLELFARERRPNWDAWGDESQKFSGAALAGAPDSEERDMSRAKHDDGEEKPTMLSVYVGQLCIGFVMPRGRAGVEAFDANARSLGIFLDQRSAADAVSEQGTPGGAPR